MACGGGLHGQEGFYSLRHTIFKESGSDQRGSEKEMINLYRKMTEDVELQNQKGVNTDIQEHDIGQYFKNYSNSLRGVNLHAVAQYLTGEQYLSMASTIKIEFSLNLTSLTY